MSEDKEEKEEDLGQTEILGNTELRKVAGGGGSPSSTSSGNGSSSSGG